MRAGAAAAIVTVGLRRLDRLKVRVRWTWVLTWSSFRYRLRRHDPLTGLGTVWRIESPLRRMLRRNGGVVVRFDVVGMQHINDWHSLPGGDRILQQAAGAVAEETAAAGGSAYRIDGDELLVLLPGLTLEEAERFAERACERVAQTDLITQVNLAADDPGTDAPPFAFRVGAAHADRRRRVRLADMGQLLLEAKQAMTDAADGRSVL